MPDTQNQPVQDQPAPQAAANPVIDEISPKAHKVINLISLIGGPIAAAGLLFYSLSPGAFGREYPAREVALRKVVRSEPFYRGDKWAVRYFSRGNSQDVDYTFPDRKTADEVIETVDRLTRNEHSLDKKLEAQHKILDRLSKGTGHVVPEFKIGD